MTVIIAVVGVCLFFVVPCTTIGALIGSIFGMTGAIVGAILGLLCDGGMHG